MCRTCGNVRPQTRVLCSHLVILPYLVKHLNIKHLRMKQRCHFTNFQISHAVHSKPVNIQDPDRHERSDENYDIFEDVRLDACEGMVIGAEGAKVRIDKLINKGSFGRVYTGILLNSGTKVAIKAEDQGSHHEKIMTEGHLMRKLAGGPGIPKLYWYTMYGSKYNFMVMEFLGPSLLDLFEMCDNIFSLQTVLKILKQLLSTFQYMHENNIMHRDISPRNIVIGVGENSSKLYLIDYGLAKSCTGRGQMLLPSPTRYGPNCNSLVGTPRFASINNHRGGIIGRSDDLEALGYLLVFFLKGHLPWSEETTTDPHEGIRQIGHLKVATSVETVCKGIPDEFATLISYARLLKCYEMPDYASINVLFNKLIKDSKVNISEKFDWELQSDRLSKSRSMSNLTRSKHSLPKIRCGSDENTLQFAYSKSSNVSFSISST